MKLKGVFPAVTAWRLAMVAMAVSLLTPIGWAIWWVPLARQTPSLWGMPSIVWETWPLALFPAGFALMTYLMFKAGMMKSGGESAPYPLHPELPNKEYYDRIDRGIIKPLKPTSSNRRSA